MEHTTSSFSLHLGRVISGDAYLPVEDEWATLPGVHLSNGKPFRLSGSQLSTHMAVLGPTGAGKSRFLWQIMREHRRERKGFCVIDDGDLAADFLADCAAEVLFHQHYSLLKKLYWIKLNPYRMPRYDPWKITVPAGLHPKLLDGFLTCARHKRVQQFMQVTQANVTGKTDFMNQPRRQRILTDVFTALSVAVGGRHLAMEDVFIFFNPSHPSWRVTLDRCVPLLPSEVKQELESLGGFKRVNDLWQQVESSVNSLRALLGPCMKQMLSSTGQEPSFDWNEAIDRGGYVIVDAHQEHASTAESIALASLMALDLGETMLGRSKERRKSFTLIVDEAAQFLGPLGREFGRWLRIMRKYGMPCVLAFQDLASMKLDELDLAPVILGQCGTIVCFRSRWHEDNERLANHLLMGNLKFVPLIHDEYQHRGEYDWIPVEEHSRSEKHDESKSSTTGSMETHGTSRQLSESHSRQHGESLGRSESMVYGPHGLVASESEAKNRGESSARGSSSGMAAGENTNRGTSESSTNGITTGWTVSVSHKLVPLPKLVHTKEKTGKLEESIPDQVAQHRQLLHGLQDRHAIVLAPGMTKAVEIETADVPDPFPNPVTQAKAVRMMQRTVAESHDFYFDPSFDPADQEARVEQFVEGNLRDREEISIDEPTQPHRNRRKPLDAPAGKPVPFED